jgi:hypothetical protein
MGFVSLRRSTQNVNVKIVEKNVQLCRIEFLDDVHKRVYGALFGTLRVKMEAILSEDDGPADIFGTPPKTQGNLQSIHKTS